ncbi:MAG TPA: histidine phosphotransferase family protein [Acetobacteraceae bacterium]|nr:histidine phosphotransferase family protein [Acetobacteraceae bacterium]
MSGASDKLRLTELVCARMSHDLGGMIGTLAGALELAEDPSVAGEALALANQAAIELRQRLQLLRATWGPTAGPLDIAALRSLAEGLPHARRSTINFAALPVDIAFSPSFARVVLNLLLLAGDALNGSGEVTLAGTGTDLVIAIAGPRAAWPSGLAGCLASEAGAWAALRDARSLQMPLTALLARGCGLRLSLLMPAGPGGPAPPLRLYEV